MDYTGSVINFAANKQPYNYMNRIKLFFAASIVAAPCLSIHADTTGYPNVSICSITVPIKKHKDLPTHNKYVPSKWEFASIEVGNGCARIDLPFDEYPVDVEVEMITSPGGFWSATIADSQSLIEGFDGLPGDYSITISTSDSNVYIGEFSIE